MREILFRAKCARSNSWKYGSLIQDSNGGYYILPFSNMSYNCGYIDEAPIYEVIPDTVGQFTGMTDKNGVKIFEGDIVRKRVREGIRNREVVFSFGTFHCGFGSGSSTATHPYLLDDKNIQVIGNVHDDNGGDE